MNIREFTSRVHSDLTADGIKITKHLTASVVDGIFKTLKSVLKEEASLTIFNFGRFFTTIVPARTCRNPANGEMIDVPEKRRAFLKFSSEFKSNLNS